MTPLSPKQTAIARNNERVILHALAAVSQKAVCEMTGISETRMSRFKDGGWDRPA